MPRVSQVIIRAALAHLALGYTLGALVLVEKGLGIAPWLWALKASHVHVLLVGALVQLACGVAVWILPRLDAAGDRGAARPVWLACGALNAGVVLAALHPPLTLLAPVPLGWMPLLAGVLYAGAAALFIIHAWRRVRPFGAPAPNQQSPTTKGREA
jgi:hypothetical protein